MAGNRNHDASVGTILILTLSLLCCLHRMFKIQYATRSLTPALSIHTAQAPSPDGKPVPKPDTSISLPLVLRQRRFI